jgi:hypothetical protein
MTDDWREQLATRVDHFFDTKLGPDIVADAIRYAPKDTGNLADHIDHSVHEGELRVTAHTRYAAAVENGHRVVSHGHVTDTVVPPRPFLRPALYKKRRYGK